MYTRGVNTHEDHILNKKLKPIVARRGGSVTLHNPGQLVVYFVVPLELLPEGLDTFIARLETSIIQTLQDYQILGFIHPQNSGVWTHKGKIAFVGIGVKKNVVYHGIAINLHNNLHDYKNIQSCGLVDPITNLQEHKYDIPTTTSWILQSDKNILQDFFIHFTRYLKKLYLKPIITLYMIQTIILVCQKKTSNIRLGIIYFNAQSFKQAEKIWNMRWCTLSPSKNESSLLHGLAKLSLASHIWITSQDKSRTLLYLEQAHQYLSHYKNIKYYFKIPKNNMIILDYIQTNVTYLKICAEEINTKNPYSNENILLPYKLYLQQDNYQPKMDRV